MNTHWIKKSLTEIELMISLLLTAGISIGVFIVKSGGFFTVASDFNCQQLTFATAVQEVLSQTPTGEWYWGLDLGSSVINGFSFYNMGSLFFWIVFILPKGTFPYVCGFLYMLKDMVAGTTAYYYLRLFVDNKRYAVVGAVVYAFSGFQTTNLMFFHFHDVVAWFPLLLFAMEMSIKDRRYDLLFIFAVFMNCITNYFFFVQEVVFLIIYFLFRFWDLPKKLMGRIMARFFIYGIVGVGMASVLFVPSVLYMMGSPRSAIDLWRWPIWWPNDGLFILKGILFPAEEMTELSALKPEEYSSTSCYLPLFGMSFVISFIRYDKGWLKKLLVFLLIVSFSPLLQSVFLLFTAVYQRWWYMFVLLLSLATIIALDKYDRKQLNRGIFDCLILSTLLGLFLMITRWVDEMPTLVSHPRRFILYYLIIVASSVCLYALLNRNHLRTRRILAAVIAFSVVTTAVTLHFYRTGVDHDEVKQSYFAGLSVPDMNDQYRYSTAYNYYTLENGIPGIGVFSSTIENSSRKFDEIFDISIDWTSQPRTTVFGLPELLSGKYRICTTADGIEIDCAKANVNSYSVCSSIKRNTVKRFDTNGVEYSIVEENACPIGFSTDKYITMDDLMRLPVGQRATALMQAAVIDKSDESGLSGYASKTNDDKLIGREYINTLIANTVDNAVRDFRRDSTGFTCKTDYTDNRLVYFSVPNDDGWDATIDGEKATIIDSGGMMLLGVPAGNHTVSFKYHTPGFRIGIVLSIIFWGAFLIYALFIFSRRTTLRSIIK